MLHRRADQVKEESACLPDYEGEGNFRFGIDGFVGELGADGPIFRVLCVHWTAFVSSCDCRQSSLEASMGGLSDPF
jgi:hypothetical protein